MSIDRVAAAKIETYTKYVGTNPSDPHAYFSRGMEYLDVGENELAIADFSETIRLKPDDCDAYNNRGNAYNLLGKHELALEDFLMVIDLDPTDINVFYNRGLAYYCLGEYLAAIKDYTKVISANGKDVEALIKRAGVSCELGEYELAWGDYWSVSRIAPMRFEGFYGGAQALLNLNELDTALENITKAIDLNPSFADSYSLRAEIYRQRGDLQLAIVDEETERKLRD